MAHLLVRCGLLLALGTLAACQGDSSCPPGPDGTDATDTADDARPDVAEAEDGSDGEVPVVECTGAGECDDGVDCTTDTCEAGRCVHAPSHAACAAGELCHRVDGCLPATGWQCATCSAATACPHDGDLCAELDGTSLCLLPCATSAECPSGFECADVVGADGGPLGTACTPTSGSCCWDPDGDGAGLGTQCAAVDCDESNPDRHPGAPEVCNGIDDDCDGTTDLNPTDCPAPTCGPDGEGFATVPWACSDTGCVAAAPVSCGEATCAADGGCAGSCTDDTTCRSGAHCDPILGACVADGTDGARCLEDRECASDNCQDGTCCAAGATCCPLPGSAEYRPCGNCSLGVQDRSCSSAFTWADWGTCQRDTGCSPGATRACPPCGTQTCTPSCTWGGCVAGANDTVPSYLGVVWERTPPTSGTSISSRPWINTPFGADNFTADAWETAWLADILSPNIRLDIPAGRAYSLTVTWMMYRDGVRRVEPTQTRYCAAACSIQIDLPVIDDGWHGFQSENMTISITVQAEWMTSCDPYTLTVYG
jgi:hypothetical protein